MSGILQQFVRAFFDENPLSQLGLIVMRNGVAERLTELSSSPVGGWLAAGSVLSLLNGGTSGDCAHTFWMH
jgi:hypothetical protein